MSNGAYQTSANAITPFREVSRYSVRLCKGCCTPPLGLKTPREGGKTSPTYSNVTIVRSRPADYRMEFATSIIHQCGRGIRFGHQPTYCGYFYPSRSSHVCRSQDHCRGHSGTNPQRQVVLQCLSDLGQEVDRRPLFLLLECFS